MVQNNSFKKLVRNLAERHNLSYSNALSKMTSEPEYRFAAIFSSIEESKPFRVITGFPTPNDAWRSGNAMANQFAATLGIDRDSIGIEVVSCPTNIAPETQFNLLIEDYIDEQVRILEIFNSVGDVPDGFYASTGDQNIEIRIIVYKTGWDYSKLRAETSVERNLLHLLASKPKFFLDETHPDYLVIRISLSTKGIVVGENSKIIDSEFRSAFDAFNEELYSPVSPIPQEIPKHLFFLQLVKNFS